MALDGTYAGLQASIAAWLDRTDLAGVIPDLIALFEANANTDPAFRSAFNRASVTLATVTGRNSVTLPSDFLAAEAVVLNFNTVLHTLHTLQNYGTATSLYTAFPYAAAAPGQPRGFIVLNGRLELAPVPDNAYPLQLYYYQKIPALAANPSGNWLLANFPQVYVFGSLIAGEAYLGADPRLQMWSGLYDAALQRLQTATDRTKYSGGAVAVKVDRVA